MPSKKGSIAYENRLARRRADRAIKRLEKELNSGSLVRAEVERKKSELQRVKELRASTYMGSRGHEIRSAEEAQRYAKVLDKEIEGSRLASERQASNLKARYELSHTYYVDNVTHQHVHNPISSYTEAEMRTFWRATQSIWQGKAKEHRFEAIMEYVAAKQDISISEVDLRELIDSVIKSNASNVAAWEQEIEKKNMRKASGADVPDDEAQEFTSADIATAFVEKKINEILEAYRKAYQNEMQEA